MVKGLCANLCFVPMNRIPAMWNFVILVSVITIACSQQQNSRRPEPHDNGHGWDIRLAVPGEPGGDYPTLNAIPRTSFSCSRKSPGYYADVETGCQVFKVCTLGATYGFQSFLCPNGTLFNQEVFVCDWWMNVNCDRSQQLFNDDNEKFSNLKLGPQLMKDIKKMLTHPVRNPYDRTVMRNNLIVMQEYKPPSGQLFPNGALIFGPERPPTNVYVPAKQRQGNFVQNSFISGDLSFAASTPSSQYIPSSFNAPGSIATRDIEILQQQRQTAQPVQNTGSYTGTSRSKNFELINNNKVSQLPYQNFKSLQKPMSQYSPNYQTQPQLSQYKSNVMPLNQIKQPDRKKVSNAAQQYTYISKQNDVINQQQNIPQLSRDVNASGGRDVQRNSVSFNSPQPTGKTFKFSRIVQKSSSGTPKSRITFKTWIVRPSKNAQLIVEPTPYTYNNPRKLPAENRIVDTLENDKNKTTEKVDIESEDVPYVYNRPTPSNKQVITSEETPLIYLPPTQSSFSNRLYSTSKNPQTSKQSHLNLPPTTYKPASQFYVPPSERSLGLLPQYVGSDGSINYQSARLVVTPPTPELQFSTAVSNNKKNPSFSLTKHSYINSNHNNLTFADILTKEKLDISVNDIVKNTNEILKTASPDVLNKYDGNHLRADNLAREFDNENHEKPSVATHKSEKLISTPSTLLEPPIATSYSDYQNSNKLLNLHYFKEPVPTNTIERTVSLKISIPETIAEYLFKNHTQSKSDNLEILNTGSSNYLVLTNGQLDENNGAELIPIGKIIWDKDLNVSNSQALIYSILADSINAAKEYNHIAKQSTLYPTSTQSQTKNINYEDIQDITNKISQLTSAQFAKENQNDGNLVLSTSSNGEYTDNSKYVSENSQQKPALNDVPNLKYSQQNSPARPYSSRLQLRDNNVIDLTEQIYSGQLYKLPVPVTSKIYNSPNFGQTSQIRQANNLIRESQRDVDLYPNNRKKQSNTDVEITPSENLSYPPTRQQLPRTEESTFHIQGDSQHIFSNNILGSDTGITAHVQDKITGTLPHPLEENKLVTYQKNKSYYLYTKLDEENDDILQTTNKIIQTNEVGNLQNAKLTRNNDLSNRVTYELFPAISYELEDEQQKHQILDALKLKEFSVSNHKDKPSNDNGKFVNYNQDHDRLVTGVDFTVLHPTTKNRVEQQRNNVNTILYRGPSSYLAPQSSVGSLGGTQQAKSYARIEQFEDNNGYSKTVPARKFSF